MENIAVEIEQSTTSGLGAKLSAFFEMTKPRIAFMLVLTSAAGFYLGTKGAFNLTLFLNAMLGITLLAFGVAVLNQFWEREIDALMERTKKRPLPSGRLTKLQALLFGLVLCVGSEVYLSYFVNLLTAILGLSVIVGYVLLYTPLKTRTSASTAIGAIPGAMPPLMGWTASAGEISSGALVVFMMLYLWQFPHFLAIAWLYRDQYKNAGIVMLPVLDPEGKLTARQIVIFTIMLIPVSLAPFFFGFAGVYYLAGSVLLGLWFLYASIKTARLKTNVEARNLLFVSVLYLPLIFGLMVFNH